ncbi:MAG: CRISPR-associated endonuclease Cas2 [Bryobacterales bacterium]|nr:CRISPR-associated endonuclease Cas2 [Bryobacterales bacterium]
MQYVICYDVSDDRRRERIATALLDYGQRIQESVFLADLDAELFMRMKSRVEKLLDPLDDRIHIFTLCTVCSRKIVQLGRATLPVDSGFYVL